MIVKMYVVHDSAVKVFLPAPQTLFARTHGEAERNFRAVVNDPKSGHLHNHPEQFTLFYVGDYDDETGVPTPRNAPEAILSGAQAKETENVLPLPNRGSNGA
ncbi:MAG: nonstructural protein [Microviridae sp.]|nr:MAG: nonstructural protein [Microviridae sp.]